MLNQFKKRKDSGFTIVEVMIVLAIAGLIILVVFLAVPALQRNSRNTQRNNDASLLGSAVNECMNNRNGVAGSCDWTATELQQYVDTTKLRQLTNISTATGSTTFPTGATATTTAVISFGVKCSADGASATTGNARAMAILFATENTSGAAINRCIEV